MERDMRLSNVLFYCTVGPVLMLELVYFAFTLVSGMLTLEFTLAALIIVAFTIVPIKIAFEFNEIYCNIFSAIMKLIATLLLVISFESKVVHFIGDVFLFGGIWNTDIYVIFIIYQFCLVVFSGLVFVMDIKKFIKFA